MNEKFKELEKLIQRKEKPYTAGDLAKRKKTGELEPEEIDLEFGPEDVREIYQERKEEVEEHIKNQTGMDLLLEDLSHLLQIFDSL